MLGYETAPLYSSVEAFEEFQEAPQAWDLVINDQSMPRMKGMELIRKMKSVRPDIKTILCTGFSNEATEEAAIAAGADCYFNKPVEIETLAATIRRMLA
jgi:DNA-binding NarL/FixJ family response regulator